MNVEQLKNSILQLAIQGKLVEQREEEGTAEELFQQIQLEKNQLIKEGKLKKSKPLPPINLDEVPFEIPANWKWESLGNFVEIMTGKRDANFGTENGEFYFFTCAKVPIRSNTYSYEGEFIILPGNGANVGQSIHFIGKFEAYQRTYLLKKILYNFNFRYLKLVLDCMWETYNQDKMYGSATPYIKLSNLTDFNVPLPPISEQQRIVDKIEELMPLIEEYGESYVKLEQLNKNFPQDIKQSILQYAIQGKLVEQREEEETAEELYQQIQLEKNQLIKEGKLKKSKPLPNIYPEEVPFEIPATWKWIRLAQISTLIQPEKISNERLEYFEARVLRGQKEPEFKLSGDVVDVGDYVILVDGENSGEVFKILKRGYIGSTFKQLFYFSKINEDYLIEFLSFYKKTFSERKIGAAIPHLNKTLFNNMPFPLPPYNEQQRIVDKIEELMPLIEEYGESYVKLEQLNKNFPQDIKQSILQYAIQGKLVEQREEEETAEELYQQIQLEKNQLIKEGKVKKSKPLPPIDLDEVPFEIPASWKWVRLEDISVITMGQSPKTILTSPNSNGIEFHQGKKLFSDSRLLKSDISTDDYSKFAETKSILISVRAPVGDVVLLDRQIAIGRGLAAIKPVRINSKFILYFFSVFKTELIKKSTGSTFQAITSVVLYSSLIPIPSLSEQQRIVDKIEELLSITKALEGEIQ